MRGRGGYNRGIREPDGPRFDEPRIVFGACAGAALYRRTLFHDIGLFDEQLFLSWEDVDLDLRAALAGHRCLYVPTAVVHHAQGASSGDWRAALERRNKAILALKGLPLPLLALYLTLLPAREAYETRAAREGVRGYLRRLAPYAREAPRALRRRARGAPAHGGARAVAAAHARFAAVRASAALALMRPAARAGIARDHDQAPGPLAAREQPGVLQRALDARRGDVARLDDRRARRRRPRRSPGAAARAPAR